MEPADYMVVEDIEVFEVLNNPLRLRILRLMMQPVTVREIAEGLDVPATRLYYHVNLLEEAGIVSVVDTRKAGAMLQKVYLAKARWFKPSPALVKGGLSPNELARIGAAVVLDGARLDAEEALANHFARIAAGKEDNDPQGTLSRSVGLFTPEQAREFADKLTEFVESEFDPEDRETGQEHALTVAFFPVAGTRPRAEHE